MFESMDDSDMLLEFYTEFLKVLMKLEPLALSMKWHRESHSSGPSPASAGGATKLNDGVSQIPPCVVGLPPAPPRKLTGATREKESTLAATSSQGIPVLPHPDLSYLLPRGADEDSVDTADDAKISAAHDPLGIVQRFFTSAEYLADSLPPEERRIPLGVCLVLALKSGRTSLICKAIYMLMGDENKDTVVDFDMKWLDDIVNAKKVACGKHETKREPENTTHISDSNNTDTTESCKNCYSTRSSKVFLMVIYIGRCNKDIIPI